MDGFVMTDHNNRSYQFLHVLSLSLSVCNVQHWLAAFSLHDGYTILDGMQQKSDKKKLHANWMVIYILTLMRFAVAIAPAATVAILYV